VSIALIFGFGVLNGVYLQLAKSMGFTGEQLLSAALMMMLGQALINPLAGWLFDRFSVSVVRASYLMLSLSIASLYLASISPEISWAIVVVIAPLMASSSSGLINSAVAAYGLNIIRPEKRGLAIGLQRISLILAVGVLPLFLLTFASIESPEGMRATLLTSLLGSTASFLLSLTFKDWRELLRNTQ